MKSLVSILIPLCLLLVQGITADAQEIYVTPGASGPVFTDRPQPGAKEVTLPPLNVISPSPAVEAATSAAAINEGNIVKPDAAAGYRSFAIVFPEDNGSVIANTAIFEVRLAVDPTLQLDERHAFTVSINGRPVGQRFTATEFMIPPEFWGDALPTPNQSMQVDASIVDGDGRVLKKAAPIRFFMRHATLRNHPPPPSLAPTPIAPSPARQPARDGAVGGAGRR